MTRYLNGRCKNDLANLRFHDVVLRYGGSALRSTAYVITTPTICVLWSTNNLITRCEQSRRVARDNWRLLIIYERLRIKFKKKRKGDTID